MNELEIKNPLTIIDKAVMNNVSVELLEKLFELNDAYEKKLASKAYKVAFVNFQKNKPELKKTRKADFGKGKAKFDYLPLPTLQKLIEPVLSENQLSYMWETKTVEEGIEITCVVSHSDGHEVRVPLIAPKDTSGNKQVIQGIGSTVSYLKRYTLEAALGLASDEDTDGAKEIILKDDENYKGAIEALKTGKATIPKIEARFEFSATIKKDFLKAQKLSNNPIKEMP